MISTSFIRIILMIALYLVVPQLCMAQEADKPALKKDELAQLVAPVALYPDALLSQIFMASTYPLEIVEADRWAKKNKSLKGDALAKELEKQKWDPSVKSLVNFPPVLASMSEKLELTTKMGDAFLSQQKEMMDTVQELRKQAQAAGNLKTTKEQKVVTESGIIVIQAANPQIVYVPTYSPTVVYGVWAYPYYPPYYYYPPPPPGHNFAVGVAVGVAWGYAWGSPNWNSGHVNVNVNQNININSNINRNNYNVNTGGNGSWQHDPGHRKGVAYRDSATSQKFNRGSSSEAAKSREAFRGRTDQGGGSMGKSQAGNREAAKPSTSSRAGAFEGMGHGTATDYSNRGSASLKKSSAGGSGGGRKGGAGRGR